MSYSHKEKSTSVDIIALVAALAFLGVVVLTIVPVTFPLRQQEAAAQQQDNTTTTTTTTPMTTTNQSIIPASSNKTFYVFGAEVEGLDEETIGIPGDIYTLPVIVVNKGDSVTVNFYNTEAEEEEEEEEEAATEEVAEERHSFTIDAQPYSVDIDVAPGESGNATFTANQEGIFPYYCKYHLPTMIGELVVLPASQPGTPPAPAT